MTLIGKLMADGELKYTQNNTPVLEVGVADVKKSGETWLTSCFSVVLYGHLAQQYAPLCKKGGEVVVMGEYERREWRDRDGRTRSSEQLIASYFRVCAI